MTAVHSHGQLQAIPTDFQRQRIKGKTARERLITDLSLIPHIADVRHQPISSTAAFYLETKAAGELTVGSRHSTLDHPASL